jgi:hypothetical protein
MTNIEAVRLKTSDKSVITREKGVGNGVDKYFKMKSSNLLASPPIEVRSNSVLLTVGADYTVDIINGIVTFLVTPVDGAQLEFTYYWSVFSDDEIQFFLDEDGGNTTVAAAHVLLAWAADAAKLAKRQTLSGGGGLGQTVIDTSVIAKELRATAKALIDTEQSLGESIPAEGLTEIPWTEQMYKRQVEQNTVRNS